MTLKDKPKLSPQWIDPRAYKIVESLQKKGFTTYLVGGCVRDLLLGIQPKDYDIATNAHPRDVKRIIPQSYIIGRRFRLVLVKRNELQFEVSTFRREMSEEEKENPAEDAPIGDNFWGTPEEDALRRDFTINAMLYDPIKDHLIDYANGLKDLEDGSIRMIGDPKVRLLEDPIRILRAIRLAHKIRFSLEKDLRQAICETAESLVDTALPRRREEFLKFLRLKEPLLPFLDCHDLGVLKCIAPTLDEAFLADDSRKELVRYMQNYHDYPINADLPLELFVTFTHAVLKSTVMKDLPEPINAKSILEQAQVKSFMKNELGMFNHEQVTLAKALQIQSILLKTKNFEKKGERRRMAILKNDAFPISLAIAQRDHSLSCEQEFFWKKQYEIFKPLIEQSRLENPPFKRKKMRRKKRNTKTWRKPEAKIK
ncbi:MAG: CCA tRNA nucleotidyltransferase [Bdellovibrionaceae bacterium]|nr:CCA tRNA nucleotidyltransferase [Pseudobdellovibrionaceae bacterium]